MKRKKWIFILTFVLLIVMGSAGFLGYFAYLSHDHYAHYAVKNMIRFEFEPVLDEFRKSGKIAPGFLIQETESEIICMRNVPRTTRDGKMVLVYSKRDDITYYYVLTTNIGSAAKE